MDADELDLVPAHELKRALLRRFDCVIVAALTAEDGLTEGSWGWRGDPHKVVGLLEELKMRLFTQREAERP